MPTVRANGVDLYYESTGTGRETVVLAHGLLMSGDMFREQVRHLSPRYRMVVYDHRGQGRSQLTAGGYDMDNLAADAAALVEALGAAPCHFGGVSMGGFVAMRLAARRPELLRSCILIETSADPEDPENVPRYRALSWAMRLLGTRAVVDRVMPIMFGLSFLADPGGQAGGAPSSSSNRPRSSPGSGADSATTGLPSHAGLQGGPRWPRVSGT